MNFWQFSQINNSTPFQRGAGITDDFRVAQRKYQNLPSSDKATILALKQATDDFEEAKSYFIHDDQGDRDFLQEISNKIIGVQSDLVETAEAYPEIEAAIETIADNLQEMAERIQLQLQEKQGREDFYKESQKEFQEAQEKFSQLSATTHQILREYHDLKERTKSKTISTGTRLKFLDSHLNEVLGMLFVMSRSPNECGILHQIRIVTIPDEEAVYIGPPGQQTQDVDMTDTYLKEKSCPGKRYLFAYVYHDENVSGGPKDNHANALIIDLKERKFLILDPHGESSYQKYQDMLRERVKANFPDMTEHEFSTCPIFSPQVRLRYTNVHEGGLCWLYSLFMIDSIISNRLNISNTDLNLIEDKFIEFFTEFAEFREQFVLTSQVLTPREKKAILQNKDLYAEGVINSILDKIWEAEVKKDSRQATWGD